MSETRGQCDGCGEHKHVLLQHGQRIGKRVVTWRECVACFLKLEGKR